MVASSQPGLGVREGDILDGKYRIEKVLGSGGMGVVVAAHHLHLDERVAIKLLLPEVLGNAEVVSRFAREARAAVKIKSEHVARVIDVGTLGSGAPYMVMEHLEGGDLQSWLTERGALPIEQAVEFILQACEAIAEAHSLGIVHRDLKPANLFCIRRADGVLSAKVLDFGISKSQGHGPGGAELALTRTAAVMGSPLYMSPEQLQASHNVDARTDIWSLGAVLFELLTRQTPFMGESLPDLSIKIASQPTPLIRTIRPEVTVGLEQVICRCLEKDFRRRYSNVAELALALAPFAPKRARHSVERVLGIIQSTGLSASALALPPSSGLEEPAKAAQTEAAWGQTAPPAKTRRTWLLVGTATLLVAAATAVVWSTRARRASQREAVPASAEQVPATDETTRSTATASPAVTAASPDPLIAPVESSKTGAAAASAIAAPSTAKATPNASTAARKTKKPSCDPPYVLDDQGRKHFKAECFVK